MDTHDRSDPIAQGSSAGASFGHPDWAGGPGSGPARRTGRRSILRGLAGQWWHILSLWVLLSAPVAYLIYSLVEPTYEAVSLLQAEPTTTELYSSELRAIPDLSAEKPYLLTQLELLKSKSVLDAALARPEISSLPMIRSSKDPKATLRDEMRVGIVGENTYLLEVALASKDPEEPAAIVNAVVKSYIDQHNLYHQKTNRALKQNLVTERDRLEQQIQDKQSDLTKLVEKGHTYMTRTTVVGPVANEDTKGAVEPSLHTVTEQQSQEMTSRLIQADFELIDARARRDAARLPGAQAPAEKIRELETAVEAVSLKRLSYKRYVTQLQVEARHHDDATELQASLLKQDLTYLKKLQDTIKQKLAQVDFEINQEQYKMWVRDKADVPKAPSSNRRPTYISVASAGILCLLFGVFLVREITAKRSHRGL